MNVVLSFSFEAHRGQTSNIVPSAGRDEGPILTALMQDVKLKAVEFLRGRSIYWLS